MFRIKELDDGSRIFDFQSPKMKDVVEFVKAVNQLYKEGFVIDDDFPPRMCPKIFQFLNVKFVQGKNQESTRIKELEFEVEYLKQFIDDDVEVPVVKEDVIEPVIELEIDLNSLSKKDELVAFAEKKNIEIPEDVTHPASIKKYLKDHMGIK